MEQAFSSKGFTLLELIVAIAIIGILSTVIFSYLEGVRDRGSEAGIQRNLSNFISQAGIFFSDNGSYVNLCTSTKIRQMVQFATRAGGIEPNINPYANSDVGSWNVEACQSDNSRYVVWIPERISTLGTPVAWCVDSTGVSKRVTGTTLPADSFVCP